MKSKILKTTVGPEIICRKYDMYGSQRRILFLAVLNLLL